MLPPARISRAGVFVLVNHSLAGFLGASVLLHAVALALTVPSPVRPRVGDRTTLSVRLLPGFIDSQQAAAISPRDEIRAEALPSEPPVSEVRRTPALIPTAQHWAALTTSKTLQLDRAPASASPSVVVSATPATQPSDAPASTVTAPLANVASPPPAPSRPTVQRIDVNAAVARFRNAQQQLHQQGLHGQHLAWLRQRVADLMRQAVGAESADDARCTASLEGTSPVFSCDSATLDAALRQPPSDLPVFLRKLIELDGLDGRVTFHWHATTSAFVQELPAAEEPGAMTTASSASSAPPSP